MFKQDLFLDVLGATVLVFLIFLLSCTEKTVPTVIAKQLVPEVIDFNFHVKPILSDKCSACHLPDINKKKADLRLDTKEGAYAKLKDPEIQSRVSQYEMAYKMQTSVPEAMDLSNDQMKF